VVCHQLYSQSYGKITFVRGSWAAWPWEGEFRPSWEAVVPGWRRRRKGIQEEKDGLMRKLRKAAT
jgi:hypothetical protein